MLTKRTNVLLTETDYSLLSNLSEKQDKSMGALIRQAIRSFYDYHPNDSRKEIITKIDKLAGKADAKGINYKELVENGRRY